MGQYFGTYGQMGQYFLKHPGFGQMGRQDGIRRVGGVNAALSEREKDRALRAPSLHFGWVLRQLSIETDAHALAEPLSL